MFFLFIDWEKTSKRTLSCQIVQINYGLIKAEENKAKQNNSGRLDLCSSKSKINSTVIVDFETIFPNYWAKLKIIRKKCLLGGVVISPFTKQTRKNSLATFSKVTVWLPLCSWGFFFPSGSLRLASPFWLLAPPPAPAGQGPAALLAPSPWTH